MSETTGHTQSGSGAFFYFGWFASVVVVLVALAGLVLAREVWLWRQTSTLEREERRGPLVLIVPVQQVPLNRSLTFPADVHGFFESPIYPKVSGYIKTVLVDKGARVKKDQLLAVLVSPELDQQVADAQAAYQIAALTDGRYQNLAAQHVLPQEQADE